MTGAPQSPDRSLVEDVRRFGLASADLVVDRFVRLADRAIAGEDAGVSPPVGRARAATLPPARVLAGIADGATGLAGAWLRLLEVTASLADRTSADAAATGTLDLPPTRAGSVAEAAVWVHNTTAAPAAVELTATTLAASGGRAVSASAVELVPARLDALPAGSSAEVRVRVHVPPDQRAGRYQGLVLTSAAEQPVLLRLEVREGASGR
jgi:hypothetical protein